PAVAGGPAQMAWPAVWGCGGTGSCHCRCAWSPTTWRGWWPAPPGRSPPPWWPWSCGRRSGNPRRDRDERDERGLIEMLVTTALLIAGGVSIIALIKHRLRAGRPVVVGMIAGGWGLAGN